MRGALVTTQLSLIAWTAGMSLGTILGVISARYRGPLDYIIRGISFIVTSIPVLVLLYWLHYPLQSLLGVVVDPFLTAALLLSVTNTLGVAAIIRHAVVTFPGEYRTAALVCGLNSWNTFRSIEFPLVLRQTLPSILQLQVVTLQATLFASLISVNELFRVSQQINALEYKPIEIYTALALFFLAICLPLNGVAALLSQRFSRDLSER